MNSQHIQLYTSEDGEVRLEIQFERETLWLSQNQISELFDTSTDNVSLHLKNIYAEGELDESATTEDFSVVREEGARQVKRTLEHYNLDAVISVGYRVSSSRATQFRIWATNTLKQHLLQGYTLNKQRLQERGIEFEQALELLSQTLRNQQLINEQGQAGRTTGQRQHPGGPRPVSGGKQTGTKRINDSAGGALCAAGRRVRKAMNAKKLFNRQGQPRKQWPLLRTLSSQADLIRLKQENQGRV